MRNLYKQLTKEMLRNKLFLFLLLLLTIGTSAMFFFVRFSIDGNQRFLDGLAELNADQMRYQKALHANHLLSYQITLWFTLLTAFVFFLFFYRYLKTNRKQIGLLKALGFRDRSIAVYFVVFTAVLSLIGALIGAGAGYYLSDILIRANTRNYNMMDLAKGITGGNLLAGLGASTLCFCLIAYVSSFLFQGKETGLMLAGENRNTYGRALKAADKISGAVPVPNKFPLRIALRKPSALLLIFIAVMGFLTCMFLGLSIYGSGAKVIDTQTADHNYNYEIGYHSLQSGNQRKTGEYQYYLGNTGLVNDVPQQIVFLDSATELLALSTKSGSHLPELSGDEIYISQGFEKLYQVAKGEHVTLSIEGKEYQTLIKDVAYNAGTNTVYVSEEMMCDALGVSEGTYNGMYSIETVSDGDVIITASERLAQLEKEAVSNQTSGVINQMTGVAVGCILLFLALLLNFQDSTRDILILSLMGYAPKEIRKMLVNIYFPVLNLFCLLALLPSVLLAKNIQESQSRQMEDYIPFGMSIGIILAAWLLINVIYFLVQLIFQSGIKRVIRKEDYSDFLTQE